MRVSTVVFLSVLLVAVRATLETAYLKEQLRDLTRHVMLQQFAEEERVRSSGDSGIKAIRLRNKGHNIYNSETFNGHSVGAMHNHGDHERTMGHGEGVYVLNGVEFRTRHTDFMLRSPSKTSGNYDEMEDIPFPEVPPDVLTKATVEEQILELREWFKAWQNQDSTHRPYKDFFKPVLCYLEGAWTTELKDLKEPYYSDRHWLNAEHQHDLQDKTSFMAHTGLKDIKENLAHLPTKIINMIDNAVPEYAQWNYKIACHQLKNDLPLNKLELVDDLASRMFDNNVMSNYRYKRAARFQLKEPSNTAKFKRGFLDELMGEIPGKDNYRGSLTDLSMGQVSYDPMSVKNKAMDVAFYHRCVHYSKAGAMGEKTVHRGFNDRNMFVAYTTKTNVSNVHGSSCPAPNKPCVSYESRVSYAIPLEVIYLTPLNKWNPYNLPYRGDGKSATGRQVTANGRSGGNSSDTAFNGINSNHFFQTPFAFFEGAEVEIDPADTTDYARGVLDSSGNVRVCSASGTRVILPNIPGVGEVRLRYPIVPLHSDGNEMSKNLEALKDIVMDLDRYRYMLSDPAAMLQYSIPSTFALELNTDYVDSSGTLPWHTHRIQLTMNDITNLKSDHPVRKFTTEVLGHRHDVTVRIIGQDFVINGCDGGKSCFHDHGNFLEIVV